VEDGLCTLFWLDPWFDKGTLKSKFNCLFDLSIRKMEIVSDMFLLGWGEGGSKGGCLLG